MYLKLAFIIIGMDKKKIENDKERKYNVADARKSVRNVKIKYLLCIHTYIHTYKTSI